MHTFMFLQMYFKIS